MRDGVRSLSWVAVTEEAYPARREERPSAYMHEG